MLSDLREPLTGLSDTPAVISANLFRAAWLRQLGPPAVVEHHDRRLGHYDVAILVRLANPHSVSDLLDHDAMKQLLYVLHTHGRDVVITPARNIGATAREPAHRALSLIRHVLAPEASGRRHPTERRRLARERAGARRAGDPRSDRSGHHAVTIDPEGRAGAGPRARTRHRPRSVPRGWRGEGRSGTARPTDVAAPVLGGLTAARIRSSSAGRTRTQRRSCVRGRRLRPRSPARTPPAPDPPTGDNTIGHAATATGRDPRQIRRISDFYGTFTDAGQGDAHGQPEQWVQQLPALAIEHGVSSSS